MFLCALSSAVVLIAAIGGLGNPTPTLSEPFVPTPSPVVPLGGQCGGLTYKGPTGCEQTKEHPNVECVFVNPYLWQCQIVSGTITYPTEPTPTSTCLTSTLACSASCKKLCPKGQHMTGSSCPFCTCETPTPLCPDIPSPTLTPTL
ncbi:hypothetical protein D9611_010246 [Ephemerocybe angulata]|uniref:CBM1 domain-containing protein n=1 Tax=Ephemerocybe angulata TaxID=980116 RepID=A0A8H5BBI8_9AGAR|nr:hypothetical protein D9611_010246 [Tulosesus angulatus]